MVQYEVHVQTLTHMINRIMHAHTHTNTGKRQTSVTIDEKVINTARAGADSCNAIVRAVAQSLLSLAGEM